jgi:hypothetical protein
MLIKIQCIPIGVSIHTYGSYSLLLLILSIRIIRMLFRISLIKLIKTTSSEGCRIKYKQFYYRLQSVLIWVQGKFYKYERKQPGNWYKCSHYWETYIFAPPLKNVTLLNQWQITDTKSQKTQSEPLGEPSTQGYSHSSLPVRSLHPDLFKGFPVSYAMALITKDFYFESSGKMQVN